MKSKPEAKASFGDNGRPFQSFPQSKILNVLFPCTVIRAKAQAPDCTN
ncbi:hypothetical protein HOLDEFILI_00135 [Holdemania filiformis DSM 12042]|uniref:Uncharacterized protein n=1 Tax=Holdemania filiformis DSM 12042 TaxID=545696 RepID=B9Y2W0_9FIRM|nr:hypothetical protein HOLDEFILI_00135 [Holdemania filiformis DSM 12042]